MKEKSVKIKKTESLLKELTVEALATLSDTRINSLAVTDVDCKGGKYDAFIYIDPAFVYEEERPEVLRQLRIASPSIEEHILSASGWFRCPKLHFEFDYEAERMKRLDAIFDKIKTDKPSS